MAVSRDLHSAGGRGQPSKRAFDDRSHLSTSAGPAPQMPTSKGKGKGGGGGTAWED